MEQKRGGLAVLAIACWVSGAPLIAQPTSNCLIPELGQLLDGAASRLRGYDDAGAAAMLAGRGADTCIDVAVAQLAVTGWVEARALAAKGGDKALLEPVNTVLRALEALRRSSATRAPVSSSLPPRTIGLQIDYADAAIRAAVAAAQDERAEMAVYLDHARDLAAVLDAAGDPSLWPVPYDDLEGELWFEVDRYAEARTAFSRALGRGATARALVGLARAADRLGDKEAACDNYRRALKMELAGTVKNTAETYVADCR